MGNIHTQCIVCGVIVVQTSLVHGIEIGVALGGESLPCACSHQYITKYTTSPKIREMKNVVFTQSFFEIYLLKELVIY